MNRYEQDWRDDDDRQSRRYRRDEGVLERIKNDVKAWFDDDDDDDGQRAGRAGYGGSANYGRSHAGRRQDWDQDNDRFRNLGSRSQFGRRVARSHYGADDNYGRGSYGQGRTWRSDDDYDRDDSYGRRGNYVSGTPVWLYSEYYWVTPGPHTGVGPKNFERSSDALKERVCERLQGNGELDAADIEVQVESDEVTLTGTVKDRQQKRMAEDCAESVYGVRDVHNRLTVQRDDNESRTRSTDNGGAKRSVN